MPTILMGPANAAVRFESELVALYGIVVGTWAGTGSVIVVVLATAAALAAWGVFRVDGDPGPAPIAVNGSVRLGIEAAVLGAGAFGLGAVHGPIAAGIFIGAVVAHYVTTPTRLRHVIGR